MTYLSWHFQSQELDHGQGPDRCMYKRPEMKLDKFSQEQEVPCLGGFIVGLSVKCSLVGEVCLLVEYLCMDIFASLHRSFEPLNPPEPLTLHTSLGPSGPQHHRNGGLPA